MIIYCLKCEVPIRDGEEVQFTASAFFKQLASRVAFSVSTPHEAEKETFRHVKCPRQDGYLPSR
jgi:hypothetical protein